MRLCRLSAMVRKGPADRLADSMTTSESIRKMFIAHAHGDDDAFREAALDFIEEERRKNHHVLARDLRAILENRNGASQAKTGAFTLLGVQNGNLPQDKERGVLLVEISEPRRGLDDLVLAEDIRSTLDRIVLENRRAELL